MMTWRGCCAAFCLLVLAANGWHLATQATPPSWDDAWYLENSFRFFHALKRGLLPFVFEYIHAFRIKAPLISLMPLPIYALVGAGERAALWVNEAFFALQMVCVYGIGRRLYNERTGLAAAVAAALIPLSYGLSRSFMVECALSALVCLFVWLTLEARPEEERSGWALGSVLGLGLLCKSLFPLYVAGPTWLRRRSLAGSARRTAWVGGAIAATWYGFNAVYALGFGLSAGFGKVVRDYGGASRLSPAVLSDYGMSLGRDALSWPYTLCAAIIFATAWQTRPRGWRWGPSEKLLIAWLGLPLSVFILGVNKDVRYLAPALPALAILLAAAAVSVASRRRAAALAVSLCVLPPSAVLLSQTFGWPAAPALAYNGAPSLDPGWDRAGVLDALDATGEQPMVVAVAFEHRCFNANNLASLAAARGLGMRFINLGHAQSSSEGALIRLKDKDADRLIVVEGPLPDDLPRILNRANAGVATALVSGRLASRRLFAVPMAPGLTAVGYQLLRRP